MPILISANSSKMSNFVRQMAVYPFTIFVYFNRAKSNQPHRRFRLVVTPISAPFVCRNSPTSFSCSVGKGPSPTRVVYALTTPMISPIACGGNPKPVRTPPILQLLLVTYGYVPTYRDYFIFPVLNINI